MLFTSRELRRPSDRLVGMYCTLLPIMDAGSERVFGSFRVCWKVSKLTENRKSHMRANAEKMVRGCLEIGVSTAFI